MKVYDKSIFAEKLYWRKKVRVMIHEIAIEFPAPETRGCKKGVKKPSYPKGRIGKPFSKERSLNASIAGMGKHSVKHSHHKPMSKEHKELMRIAHTGKKHSKQWNKNIKKGHKSNIGKKYFTKRMKAIEDAYYKQFEIKK